MGKHLFLCVSACFLFSSYDSDSQTANPASYNLQIRSNTGQPAITTTLLPDVKNKKPETSDITEVKKNAENVASVSDRQQGALTNAAQTKAPEEMNLPDVKDSIPVISRANDSLQNKENGKDELNEADQAAAEEEVNNAITKYAQQIGVEPYDITNYPLYHFIDGWYGIQYKWGGTDSGGIDCSAFSQKLYGRVFGVELLRTTREQHRHCEHIRHSEDASEGDLVFFRIHHFRISHVGIYLANGYFVHASSSHGVTISSLNDKYWRRRYAGCGRISKEVKSISESDFTP